MVLLLSMMAGGVFGYFVYLFLQTLERESLRAKWFSKIKMVGKEGFLLSWNRPLISLTARFFKVNFFESLLKAARLETILTPPEFFSWMLLLGLESAALTGRPWIFILGFFYPLAWLSAKKGERIKNIRRDLPLVMDLLAISVSAGMDMMQAIQRIVKALPPSALLKEFEQMLEDLKLGRTRKEALTTFKNRIPLSEVRSLVAMLLQTIQLGSPLAPVLLASADLMRAKRFMEAERMGVQASQKILLPLVFCILPAIFLTIFSPLIIRYLTGGFQNLL